MKLPKWKPATVTITTPNGPKDVDAHVAGVWALHPNPMWVRTTTLTHVPTGLLLTTAASPTTLKRAVKAMVAAHPELLTTTSRDELAALRHVLQQFLGPDVGTTAADRPGRQPRQVQVNPQEA